VPARFGLLPLRNGKNKHRPLYREKTVYSTQFEKFKESGAVYGDRDVVVDGNLFIRTNEKLGEVAMKEQMKELQKLKGIGEVLSRHLVESSYDTIAKDEEVQS